MKDKTVILPGRYYARDPFTGRVHDTGPDDPDVIICRRVADFTPDRPMPPGGVVIPCSGCRAPVYVERTSAQYPRPKRCFQCEGWRPA